MTACCAGVKGDLHAEHNTQAAVVSDHAIKTAARVACNAVTGLWISEYGLTGTGHIRSTSMLPIMHRARGP